MASKLWLWLGAVSLSVGCAAGCHAPPPVVVSAPPTPAPPPAPPPPPPPPCVALTENCTATDSTQLGIGEHGSTLVPPSGWKYAKLSDRSVAVSPEGKSLLSALELASSDEASALSALEKLTVVSGIEKVKFDALKKRFKKPQFTVDANGSKVDFWEVSKATGNGANPELHEQGAGTLLVFVAHQGSERALIGLGFVVVPDAEADAEKIMQAVQSSKGTP